MTPRRWLCASLGVLAALVLAFAGWLGWTRHRVETAKERCRAAGLPMRLEEIRPRAVPPADNAAPLVEKIDALLKAPALQSRLDGSSVSDVLEKFRKSEARVVSASELDTLAELLATPAVRDVLALAREAAAKRGYDAQLPYDRGAELTVKNVQPLRGSVLMLAAAARVAALRGERDRAAADIRAMLAIGEMPRDEPIFISQLVRMACHGITIEALEKIVAADGLTASALDDIAQRIAAIELGNGFVRAMSGERLAMGGWVFENVLAGKTDMNRLGMAFDRHSFVLSVLVQGYRMTGLVRLEYAGYLDRMREITLEMRDPDHTPSEQRAALQRIGDGIPRHHLLTKMIMPALSAVCLRSWQGREKISVAAVGLALERHRRVRGEYPAELRLLVPDFLPALPLDVFNRQPLRYVPQANGALVYSVGPNLRDDGGKFDHTTQKDDVPWHAGGAQ